MSINEDSCRQNNPFDCLSTPDEDEEGLVYSTAQLIDLYSTSTAQQVISTQPLNQVILVFKPNIIGQIGALTVNNQIVTLKYVTRLLTT